MSRIFYVSFWGTRKDWWDRLDLLFDSLSKDFEVYDVGFLHNHAFKIVIEKDDHVNYVRFLIRFKKLESKIIINQLFRFPFLIYLVAKFKPVAIIFFSNVVPLYILTIILKMNILFNFKVILDLDEFGGKEEEKRSIINKIYDKITMRFLRFSNLILVLNNFAKNFLKTYGIKDSKIFNEAVGKDEEIKISIGGNINGGFSIYSPVKEKTLRIRSISLRKILEENNLNNPYLLKADCKGCEYYIIEDDAISKFEKVKIEYTGFNRPKVDYIINKLKSKGFSKFRVFKHNYGIYHLSDHGTIYAEK